MMHLLQSIYMDSIKIKYCGLTKIMLRFTKSSMQMPDISPLCPLCSIHAFLHYSMIYLLLKGKRVNTPFAAQKIMLKEIKKSISTTAARFSGYSQHVCECIV